MSSEQTLPYKPREISKIDAAIFRELIFSKRSVAIFPQDPAKKICFFEVNSSNGIHKKISFSLQVGQEKVDLSIELKPGTPLVDRIKEVGGFESLPEEFRVALMTFASREIIDALEHLFQLPVDLIYNATPDMLNAPGAVSSAASSTGDSVMTGNAVQGQKQFEKNKELYFEIFDARGRSEARASMTLSLSMIEQLLLVVQKTPMIKNNSLTGKLLQGEIFAGSATISLEEWKSLKPGDLIVIQEPSAITTGEGKCFIKKSGVIPITLNPDFFKSLILPVEKMPLLLPHYPTEEEDASHPVQKNRSSISTSIPISLELNFSAGLLSLTIEETLQLLKTKSLEKPFPVLRPLKIFIQEQVVGTGELIEINGRYALAITQLSDYAS